MTNSPLRRVSWRKPLSSSEVVPLFYKEANHRSKAGKVREMDDNS